ncbi:MAG: FHA domain-containing protein [Archangium sp.]|nr:FHA domain-containing protein [Archangium sp.]
MGFTLRVTQGAGESEEFSFDGGEARMGRTADNDVVIRDPSSSRVHARVYEEEGQCFVEDLKSANGTTLNKRPLKSAVALESGDLIAIGEVVLEFQFVDGEGPSSTLDGEEEPVDAHETILKPPSKPATAAVVRKPPPRKPTAEVAAAAARPRPSRVIPATAAPEAEAVVVPTAADRARERRELQRSTTGRAQLLWNELPRPTRIAVGIIGGLATLGMLGLLVSAVLPKRVPKKYEPMELVPNGDAIPDSFGEGDQVTFSRPDMKSFTFTFAAPTAIVGVLHYQAADCSKDEVTIELNGTQVGTVPPDTMEVEKRDLEIVLPSTLLHVNGPANELVFDNVTNPPANDPWRIWNIWVEVIPIPRMSAEDAARRAKDDLSRAATFYDLRAVGAMNLFRSWKQYRDAWLLLEATPDSPPELVQLARTRMREIRPQLDAKCSSMLVAYQKQMNQRYPNIRGARRVLQDIPSYFEKEHPCFGMSRGLLANLEDLSEVE